MEMTRIHFNTCHESQVNLCFSLRCRQLFDSGFIAQLMLNLFQERKGDRGGDKKSEESSGGGDEISLSIEETNKLRAKLGLAPLEVDDKPKVSKDYPVFVLLEESPRRSYGFFCRHESL